MVGLLANKMTVWERERERAIHPCKRKASIIYLLSKWWGDPALSGDWTCNLFGVPEDAPTNWATSQDYHGFLKSLISSDPIAPTIIKTHKQGIGLCLLFAQTPKVKYDFARWVGLPSSAVVQ